MTDRLTIALAQLNPTVGGVEDNVACILKAREEARALGADLMLASELVVCGYPPEDLVLKPAFIDAVVAAVERLAQATSDGGPAVIAGSPWRDQGKVMNAALLLDQGRIAAVRYKHELPNYGVFDEKRVFAAGPLPGPMHLPRRAAGRADLRGHLVADDAAASWPASGAEMLLVPNGSPFEVEKLRPASRAGAGAGHRDRPAARLCQPGRRPGRARLRRRLVRHQRRRRARARSCRSGRKPSR